MDTTKFVMYTVFHCHKSFLHRMGADEVLELKVNTAYGPVSMTPSLVAPPDNVYDNIQT